MYIFLNNCMQYLKTKMKINLIKLYVFLITFVFQKSGLHLVCEICVFFLRMCVNSLKVVTY